jgi:hypothetical protein
MCIILGDEPVRVSNTSIFARHDAPGSQLLVYSMRVFTASPTAMILPLPVRRGSGEDALRFIDLSGYPEFFEDMSAACRPELESLALASAGAALAELAEPLLEVHEVGDFEASFVPGLGEFQRLDPRFQLSPDVWARLPDYSDYGFAVFQLRLAAFELVAEAGQEVHPMAFAFPTRDPLRLFYPTVHVHDRDYHPVAGFDHSLYCQRDDAHDRFGRLWRELTREAPAEDLPEGLEPLETWFRRTRDSAASEMDAARSAGTLDPDARLYAFDLSGEYPNRDIWVG